MYYFKIKIYLFVTTLICYIYNVCSNYADGYSYKKFIGPVSGQVHKVQVNSAYYNPHQRDPYNAHAQQSALTSVDFIAKPHYAYEYGVEDPHTGNKQAHKESRDGNTVNGEYSVIQSDGVIRTVKYQVSPSTGFKATIHYN